MITTEQSAGNSSIISLSFITTEDTSLYSGVEIRTHLRGARLPEFGLLRQVFGAAEGEHIHCEKLQLLMAKDESLNGRPVIPANPVQFS